MCFFSSSYPLHLFTVCREHNLVSNVKIATRSLFPEVTYIFHCLPWKVVISSQWVNSSRQPSLSASHSGLPNGIQNELLRWGLKKRLQPGGVDTKKQRSFPVCAHGCAHTHTHTHPRVHAHAHTHTHTHSGMQESRLRILTWLSH